MRVEIKDGIVYTPRTSPFIAKFVNKYPDIICPEFHVLKWAIGCAFDPPCDMCWLQGTQNRYFLRLQKEHQLDEKPRMVIYTNTDDLLRQVERWLLKTKSPSVLNCGELTDSLNTPEGVELAFTLIRSFILAQTRHKVLFVTKSSCKTKYPGAIIGVDALLDKINKFYPAIFSFSVTPNIEYERGADNFKKRLAAAKTMSAFTDSVRLRIDPLIPIFEWAKLYENMIDAIVNYLDLKFERITIGRLRWFPNARAMVKDKILLSYAPERRPEDRRWVLSDEAFIQMASFIMERFPEGTQFALCKEPKRIWKALGLDWKKIKCNCTI